MQLYKSDAIRKTARFLRNQPEVANVKSEKNKYIHIDFTDGFIEHWSYHEIQEKSKFYGRFHKLPDNEFYPFDNKWPEFRCQFSRISDDPLYDIKGKFFLYTNNYLSGFKFGNIRVFLHRYAAKLASEGYVQPWLPDDDIKNIVKSFNSLKLNTIRSGKVYKERFEFIKELRPIITMTIADGGFWDVSRIFTTLDRLYKKKIKITRSNIIWYMRKAKKIRFNAGYPVGMAVFLRDHCKNMPIIDHVGMSWLKIVALLNGVEYKTDGDGAHFTDNKHGFNREIIIGDGDYKIIGANPNNEDFITFTFNCI